jgi:predicted DNA-binding transcriptional regulator AlpA
MKKTISTPLHPTPPADPNRLVRLPEILQILPVKKSTWWLWVKTGKAPAPIHLGRCTARKYADIVALATEGITIVDPGFQTIV